MKLRSTLFENLIVFISPNADVDEAFRKQLAEHGAVVALNVNKRVYKFGNFSFLVHCNILFRSHTLFV